MKCTECPDKKECDKSYDYALAGVHGWRCKYDQKGTRETAREIAGMAYRIADCLASFSRILSCHDCNDCGIADTCKYCPGPGETVRINCPLWKEKKDEGLHSTGQG